MRAPRLRVWLLVGLLALGLAPPTVLNAQLPPDARWRTLTTPHFRVHFTEGLDTLARRAGERAEAAYALLAGELPHAPTERVDLMVANNVDLANGYATPYPTNRIVIYAHPPVGTPELALYEDWVEVVVLHELVHIFHLDTSEGVWRRLRALFGRNLAFFPEVYSPGWLKEGLAVYYDTRFTPTGRLRAARQEMALRTAVLEDALFSIDRVSGDPVLWPAGNARYIYGSRFLDFLARRHGPESMASLVARYGRQLIPFAPDAAARRTFGTSFTRAWRAFSDSLRSHYAAQADSLRAAGLTEPELLTPAEGRVEPFPRYGPGQAGLAYLASTGRDEPTLRLLRPDGGSRVVTGVTFAGPPSWTPDGRELLFSQLEYVDPYRIYSDLHRVGAEGGTERVTRRARLLEAHLHPDGRRVVAVADAEGTNLLVVRDLATGATRALTPRDLDVQWSLPRWSPRGDQIAVGRWRAGGLYDVVLLDSAGTVTRELTRDRALDTAPAWSPDGRYVLFSSDRTGIPNLFAYDLQEGVLRQVSNVLTGATQPDVSPDGRWIAFAYYRADGWQVARLPFDPRGWRAAPSVPGALAAPLDSAGLERAVPGPAGRYSPFPSVLPSTWSLLLPGLDGADRALGYGVGVALSGVDAIERHLWGASGSVYPDGTRFDGGVAYRYRGLGRPVLDASVSQRWSEELAKGTLDRNKRPLPSAVLRREKRLGASALWEHRRWRSSGFVQAGGRVTALDYVWDEPTAAAGRTLRDFPLDLSASLSSGFGTARRYAYSIGAQEGVAASVTVEGHRYARAFQGETAPRGYLRFTGRGRGYQPLARLGFGRQVLAARAEFGAETGSRSPGFSIGGASGGTAPLPIDLRILGEGLSFPLRGYQRGVQVGNRAVSASAEYRVPLALVQRGFRLFPVFLDRVSADLFADAGAAWCAAGCERFVKPITSPRPLLSAGAELVLDLDVGYGADLPLRFGAAFPLRPPMDRSPQLYVRVGRAF